MTALLGLPWRNVHTWRFDCHCVVTNHHEIVDAPSIHPSTYCAVFSGRIKAQPLILYRSIIIFPVCRVIDEWSMPNGERYLVACWATIVVLLLLFITNGHLSCSHTKKWKKFLRVMKSCRSTEVVFGSGVSTVVSTTVPLHTIAAVVTMVIVLFRPSTYVASELAGQIIANIQ